MTTETTDPRELEQPDDADVNQLQRDLAAARADAARMKAALEMLNRSDLNNEDCLMHECDCYLHGAIRAALEPSQ